MWSPQGKENFSDFINDAVTPFKQVNNRNHKKCVFSHKYRLNSLHVLLFFTVPPSLITKPTDQRIIETDTAIFHCNATGNPAPNITWTKDGKTVSTGDTLSFQSNRNDSGIYWCSAENGLNSTVNASVTLDVQCTFIISYPLLVLLVFISIYVLSARCPNTVLL